MTKGGLISKTIREYEYDTYGRPIRIKDLYDFSDIGRSMERSYTYDANGNQTKAVDTVTSEIVLMQYNEIDMMSKYETKKDIPEEKKE